jgi:hypothetical protein
MASPHSIIVQWLLRETRRIAAQRAQGKLPHSPTPEQLASQAVEAALGNLALRERGGEIDSATVWSVRP